MLALLLSANALSSPTSITFNRSVYHVARNPTSSHCFNLTDILELTGVVTDAAGGKVQVHVANATLPDFALTVSQAASKTQALIELASLIRTPTEVRASYLLAGPQLHCHIPVRWQAGHNEWILL